LYLGTIHRSTNQPGSDTTMSHSSNNDRLSVIPSSSTAVPHRLEPSTTTTTATANAITTTATIISDPKLRTHHGAVDQEALTSRPPAQVFNEVKQTLKALGLEFKRDGGEYKLKCVRPKRAVIEKRKLSQSSNNMHRPPFRNLLRRASAQHGVTAEQHEKPNPASAKPATIYGDPNVDPGEEVRFSVELCKIKNLPGLYIVDMRRMRGNVWAYKFIYRTLLDTLKLGGKKGYLNTSNKKREQEQETKAAAEPEAVAEEEEEGAAVTQDSMTEENHSQHRMSTASSSAGNSSSVLLDDVHTTPSTPTPTANAREIAV
jgi:hypothetical protein